MGVERNEEVDRSVKKATFHFWDWNMREKLSKMEGKQNSQTCIYFPNTV